MFKDVKTNFTPESTYKQINKGHGRIEKRHVSICQTLDYIRYWPGLTTLIQVKSERQVFTHNVIEVTTETRYYISSLSETAQAFAMRIRGYWGVENQVHYVRDVTQGEDASRIRTTPLPQVLATARISLMLLQQQLESCAQPESIALDYYNYQVLLQDRTLAYITHDKSDFATLPWVVEINDEEVHRATTVAKCENWVKWHYRQGTLPVHDEWLTAREEFLDHIEEQADAIAPEPAELPVTEVKVARQLEIGDKVVIDGEIWRIERINRQFVQYQVWHSEVHGIRFHLTLLPNAYQYRPYKGEPTNWESARQHEFAESDRYVDTAKYLYPYSEARFDVVVKAIAKRRSRTSGTVSRAIRIVGVHGRPIQCDLSRTLSPR